jgi:hypothetical protein
MSSAATRYGGFLCLLVLAGCGRDDGLGKLVPVSGRVLVDGKSLTAGHVSFRPDADRGNQSPHYPTGAIDSSGTYTLYTANRAGAPPGAYRIVIFAQDIPYGNSKQATTPITKALVNSKYADAKTTDLTVEVSESAAPGTYDLNLRR